MKLISYIGRKDRGIKKILAIVASLNYGTLKPITLLPRITLKPHCNKNNAIFNADKKEKQLK